MEDKQAFLLSLAKQVWQTDKHQLGEITIVLPSGRSVFHFRNYLAEIADEAFIFPEIVTIAQFIQSLSGLFPIDNDILFFRLYQVYREHISDPEPFESFAKWGRALLAEFNEIDNYQVDADQIFLNLYKQKEIDTWYPGGNFSESAAQYLNYWRNLGLLYHQIKENVLRDNLAWPGLMSRLVAERLRPKEAQLPRTKVWFAGLNALSKSEINIITAFLKKDRAQCVFDADAFFVDHPEHEAGLFLRQHLESGLLKEPLANYLQTASPKIAVGAYQSRRHMLQDAVKMAQELPRNQRVGLILTDELMLPALLEFWPESLDANISIGLAIDKAPITVFLKQLWQIKTDQRFITDGILPFRVLIPFLKSPFFEDLGVKLYDVGIFRNQLIKGNKAFVHYSTLQNVFPQVEWEKLLGVNQSSGLDYLITCANQFKSLERRRNNLQELKAINEVLHNLILTLNNFPDIPFDLDTIHQLLLQTLNATKLTIKSDRSANLQVTGILETRAIDYDHLIFVGMTEGLLPATKSANSLIPNDLRYYFNLPGRREKDAVFAYHFYRLLMRAKTVKLLYEETGLSNSANPKYEPSRYIAQLNVELKQNGQSVLTRFTPENIWRKDSFQRNEIIIKKDAQVISLILERISNPVKGISPSMVNSLQACTLQAWFRYFVNIAEPTEPEEWIDDGTLGTIVHKVLEDLYQSLNVPHLMQLADYDNLRAQLPQVLNEVLVEIYGESNLNRGKNILILELIKKWVLDFLKHEEALVKDGNQLIIEKLEVKEHAILSINGKEIYFKGFPDRVQRVNGQLEIVDFKTGNFEQKDITIGDFAELSDSGKAKALQLWFYAWVYNQSRASKEQFQAAILSFRKLKAGYHALNIVKEKQLGQEHFKFFTEFLETKVLNLLDTEIPISQTTDLDQCVYCTYNGICKRNI